MLKSRFIIGSGLIDKRRKLSFVNGKDVCSKHRVLKAGENVFKRKSKYINIARLKFTTSGFDSWFPPKIKRTPIKKKFFSSVTHQSGLGSRGEARVAI